MRAAWLPALTNLLVVGFALDAGLSLVDEIVRPATGSVLWVGPRNTVAAMVLSAAVMSAPLLLLTPRLPRSVLLPLIGSLVWLNSGAAPLALFMESPSALSFLGAWIQLGIAGALLLWIRTGNGGRGWLFAADAFGGPVFSLRHTLGFGAATVVVGVPVAASYFLLTLLTWVQVGSQGFVSFDLTGVSLDDRRYVDGSREVRLVGMMHIGEERAYRAIVSSFSEDSTILLAEGVSDDRAVLEPSLSYEGAARALGLQQQEDLRSYLAEDGEPLPEWPVVRHADVDVSDFAPETIEWLSWAGEVWDGSTLLGAIRKIAERSSENAGELAIVERDIFGLRNEHLLGEIDAALVDYTRVIVPWGALHLPFIEAAMLERGFEPSQSQRRKLVSWMTILAAIL